VDDVTVNDVTTDDVTSLVDVATIGQSYLAEHHKYAEVNEVEHPPGLLWTAVRRMQSRSEQIWAVADCICVRWEGYVTYVNDCQGLGVAEDSAAPLSDDPLVDHPKEAPLLGYSKEEFFSYGSGV